jgi:hypothetical protein
LALHTVATHFTCSEAKSEFPRQAWTVGLAACSKVSKTDQNKRGAKTFGTFEFSKTIDHFQGHFCWKRQKFSQI